MGLANVQYEVVIGLEVHVHLKTDSKMFCSCGVRYGEGPNSRTCPVCLALPGALPVMNERAIELAVRLGLATDCEVREHSVMSRKNYFYPDLPKGYQISQYDQPINEHGHLDIEVEEGKGVWTSKRIGITRIHLEEDAGKSIHDDSVAGADVSHMDLNRSGVPLVEVVSEPDMRSAEEAGAYLRTLHNIIRYTGVSDADMEKGQFRCDANVSIRPKGSEEFGTRTEIKNLNSFRFVEDAIRAEVRRQKKVLSENGVIVQATMGFDRETKKTRVLRLKEDAHDYRYFPEPDLLPVVVEPGHIEEVRVALPELPGQKRERFQSQYELSEYDSVQLTASRGLADFFEAAVKLHDKPKSIANWILRDVLKLLKEKEAEIEDLALSAESLAGLVRLVDEGRLTAKVALDLLPELAESGEDPAVVAKERGLETEQDSGVVEAVVNEVFSDNPDAKERYLGGEDKILNFLMGQVMKKTQGKANPGQVREMLMEKLKE